MHQDVVLCGNGFSMNQDMLIYISRSSGILDDSESDTLSEAKSRGDSVSSPPPTPTSVGPEIVIEGLPAQRDEYLSQAKQSSRYYSIFCQNFTLYQSVSMAYREKILETLVKQTLL